MCMCLPYRVEQRLEQVLEGARAIAGRDVVGHEGEDVGTSAALFLDRSSGTGAIVLANGDAFASGDRDRARALEDLLQALLDAVR